MLLIQLTFNLLMNRYQIAPVLRLDKFYRFTISFYYGDDCYLRKKRQWLDKVTETDSIDNNHENIVMKTLTQLA